MKELLMNRLIKRKKGKMIYKVVGWNNYFNAPILLNLKTNKKYTTIIDDNWVIYNRLDFGKKRKKLKLYKHGVQ